MIGALVTFQYADRFDEQALRKIANEASAKFVGMPGLRSKAFTVSAAKRTAMNMYIWESEAAARAFFSETLLARVADVYGVRPSVEFVEIAALVENPGA